MHGYRTYDGPPDKRDQQSDSEKEKNRFRKQVDEKQFRSQMEYFINSLEEDD